MSGLENNGPLLLAVPSKGRLQENATAFFGRAGLSFVQPRGARDYRGSVAGVEDVEILFLSASEITQQLAQGSVHLGVTGEDLVRESIEEADQSVTLLAPLGFGSANVVVAVPQAWIDVRSIADLEDVASDIHQRNGRRMRVATKYVALTRRFFAQHGLFDYQIVESAGATEGAPAAGTAEIIVDITTTGATLASNALKVLDDGIILKSEANLVASLKASWSQRARQAARTILSRIDAAETARRIREIRVAVASVGGGKLERLVEDFSANLPFGLSGTGTIATIHVAAKSAEALAQALAREGAGTVVVGKVDYVFSGNDGLTEALLRKIGDQA